MPSHQQVNVKVTQQELDQIEKNAKAAGLSKSAFIRFVAVNSKIQVVFDDKSKAAD